MNSSELKQNILAMMLGDGFVDYNAMSGKARIGIYHCKQQLPLLVWKKQILEQVKGITCRIVEKTDKRVLLSGKVREGYRLQSNFSPYLGNLHVAPDIYKLKQMVKPMGLAMLWQDDGTLIFDKHGYYSTATLCTDNWGVERVIKFRDLWNKQYGWTPELMEYLCRGKTYPRLRMRKNEMLKFTGIIKSYVQPCMSYKLLNS